MLICRRLLQAQAQAGIGFDFKTAGGRKKIPPVPAQAQAQAGIGSLCRRRHSTGGHQKYVQALTSNIHIHTCTYIYLTYINIEKYDSSSSLHYTYSIVLWIFGLGIQVQRIHLLQSTITIFFLQRSQFMSQYKLAYGYFNGLNFKFNEIKICFRFQI